MLTNGRGGMERGVPVADAAGTRCWLVSGDGDRSAGLRSHRAGCSPICTVLGFVGRWQGGVWAQLTAGHRHTQGVRRGPRAASAWTEGSHSLCGTRHYFQAEFLSPTHMTLDSLSPQLHLCFLLHTQPRSSEAPGRGERPAPFKRRNHFHLA